MIRLLFIGNWLCTMVSLLTHSHDHGIICIKNPPSTIFSLLLITTRFRVKANISASVSFVLLLNVSGASLSGHTLFDLSEAVINKWLWCFSFLLSTQLSYMLSLLISKFRNFVVVILVHFLDEVSFTFDFKALISFMLSTVFNTLICVEIVIQYLLCLLKRFTFTIMIIKATWEI